MDAVNKVLRLVGHAISLDKVLTRIARLAPGSMLAGVRTHQQTSNTSYFKRATNYKLQC